MTPEISIVVPVYNSMNILPELLRRIYATMLQLRLSYEIILVDDNSPDKSWEQILLLQKQNANIISYKNVRNRGQAYSSLQGISMSKGAYVVTIDDDLEYEPSDIIPLYHKIKDTNADIVFGVAEKKYLIRSRFPALVHVRNKILNFFWNKPYTDSFKIFKREVVFQNNIFFAQDHFEGHITRHKHLLNIQYINVNYNKRFSGKSNYTFSKKVRLFLQMTKGFLKK